MAVMMNTVFRLPIIFLCAVQMVFAANNNPNQPARQTMVTTKYHGLPGKQSTPHPTATESQFLFISNIPSHLGLLPIQTSQIHSDRKQMLGNFEMKSKVRSLDSKLQAYQQSAKANHKSHESAANPFYSNHVVGVPYQPVGVPATKASELYMHPSQLLTYAPPAWVTELPSSLRQEVEALQTEWVMDLAQVVKEDVKNANPKTISKYNAAAPTDVPASAVKAFGVAVGGLGLLGALL